MEQEVASIITCVLNGFMTQPKAYYDPVSERFAVPAIYFSAPRLVEDGYTLSHYQFTYSWQLVCYHSETRYAAEMAQEIASRIARNRKAIRLINADGVDTGKCFRLQGIELEDIGEIGTFAVNLTWRSARPYNAEIEAFVKRFIVNLQPKETR